MSASSPSNFAGILPRLLLSQCFSGFKSRVRNAFTRWSKSAGFVGRRAGTARMISTLKPSSLYHALKRPSINSIIGFNIRVGEFVAKQRITFVGLLGLGCSHFLLGYEAHLGAHRRSANGSEPFGADQRSIPTMVSSLSAICNRRRDARTWQVITHKTGIIAHLVRMRLAHLHHRWRA